MGLVCCGTQQTKIFDKLRFVGGEEQKTAAVGSERVAFPAFVFCQTAIEREKTEVLSMRKYIKGLSVLLAAGMLFGFAACGGGTSDSSAADRATFPNGSEDDTFGSGGDKRPSCAIIRLTTRKPIPS